MWQELWYRVCTTCRPKNSITVRYAFPLAAVALVIAGTLAAAITGTTGSYIKITTSPSAVKAGDTFFVTVSVVAATPANAVDISVALPTTQMDILGIDTGNSVITLWTKEPYAKEGVVYLSGGTFRKGFVGEHEIARIKVKAIESGTAHISTKDATLVAGDGKGTDIKLADNGDVSTGIYITNADGSLVGKATVQIVTDINGDGSVDMSDILAFMSAWKNLGTIFDFNGDGKMTFSDFGILLADSFFKH